MALRPGIVWMLVSTLSFTLMSACIKAAYPMANVQQAVFFRSIVALPILIFNSKLKGESLWGSKRPLLFVRGIVGGGNLILYTFAITLLPLGELTMLIGTGPIWIALLSGAISKEKTPSYIYFLLPFFMIGLLLIIKPGHGFDVLPALAGLLTAVINSFIQLFIRNLRKTETPNSIVFYFLFFSTVFATPQVFTHWQPLTSQTILLLIASGVFALLAQISMTYAFRLEPAHLVSLFAYFGPIFGFLFGVMLFDEVPDVYSLVGSILIISCGLYAANKTIKAQPTEKVG